MFPKIIKLSILFILLLAGCNTASASFTVSRPPTLNAGLVGYWTFDLGRGGNTVYDVSGQGNRGTIKGTATWTDGRAGAALNFNGSGYVELTNVNTIGSDDSFSISTWINTGNVGSGNTAGIYGEFNVASTETRNFLSIIGAAEQINFDQYGPLGGASEANSIIPTNEWHYVTYVQNGVSWQTYLDGKLDNSGADAETYTGSAPDKSWIGARATGSGIYSGSGFIGKIDELRIYNRVLSADEVYRLYKLTRTKVNISPVNTLTSGLVGYWTFDGADTNFTTNTVADKSGNGNTGTMTNMSTSTARAPGKIGQALRFDGVNDYVNANMAYSLTDFYSMSIWVKQTGNGDYNPSGLLSIKNNVPFLWLYNNNSFSFYINLVVYPTPVTSFQRNKWEHLVATYDHSLLKLYLNGVEVYSVSLVTTLSGDNTIWIGEDAYGRSFNGLIDEVRVYNRALSSSEVKTLYNMGR